MTTSLSPIRLALRGVVAASVCLAACASSTSEDAATTDTALAGACGFTVRQNAYDGPGYWGTISFRNGSQAVTGIAVSFDAPAGARCTNDTVPPGATLSPPTGSGASARTTSSRCTFTWNNVAFAAGATRTFNYSTDGAISGAASNLTVSYASCVATPPPPPPTPPPPAPDAGGAPDSGGGGGATDCNSPDLVWRTANKTNFTSYPDPGSEECTRYNGCAYEGQFSACSQTEPVSWVKSHNIVSVFPNLRKASNGIPALALHDLCLKSGSKSIVVTVLDECADSDCSGCCTQNKGGEDELIDIESFTDAKWGVGDGKIQWADLGPTKTAGCN